MKSIHLDRRRPICFGFKQSHHVTVEEYAYSFIPEECRLCTALSKKSEALWHWPVFGGSSLPLLHPAVCITEYTEVNDLANRGEQRATFLSRRFLKQGKFLLGIWGHYNVIIGLSRALICGNHPINLCHGYGPFICHIIKQGDSFSINLVGETALLGTSGISDFLAIWLSASPLSTVGNVYKCK